MTLYELILHYKYKNSKVNILCLESNRTISTTAEAIWHYCEPSFCENDHEISYARVNEWWYSDEGIFVEVDI